MHLSAWLSFVYLGKNRILQSSHITNLTFENYKCQDESYNRAQCLCFNILPCLLSRSQGSTDNSQNLITQLCNHKYTTLQQKALKRQTIFCVSVMKQWKKATMSLIDTGMEKLLRNVITPVLIQICLVMTEFLKHVFQGYFSLQKDSYHHLKWIAQKANSLDLIQ